MQSDYRFQRLDAQAANYLQRLRSDGNSLSQHAFNTIDWNKGVCGTFMPADAKIQALSSLDHSIGLQRSKSQYALWNTLRKILPQRETLLIAEHSNWRRGDSTIAVAGFRTVILGDRLCYWSSLTNTNAEEFSKALDRTQADWGSFACLTNTPTVEPALSDSHPGDADKLIEAIVASTLAVVMSVFDGEGQLVWIAQDHYNQVHKAL